jgi:hypothetical protein
VVFLLADRPDSVVADRLGEAHSSLLRHVPGFDGLCLGCLDMARLALAPCPVARRALSVVETHGVNVWDVRPTDGASTSSDGVVSGG